jgi:hypothetical protein
MMVLGPDTVHLMLIAVLMSSIVKPGWLTSSIDHKLSCLWSLKGIDLKACCLRLDITISTKERCIAVKSSVPQGMIVCFDKEVGWCVGIAVILVVGRE